MSVRSIPNVAEVAALIGDKSRARILTHLLTGKSAPASELARVAGITPQTASIHLSKLVEAQLLSLDVHGRHRYYRLASSEVGHALESLGAIAKSRPIRSLRESDQAIALHFARTCYDHVAGKVGVALADHFLAIGLIEPSDRDYHVTAKGVIEFRKFGIEVASLQRTRRKFARQCLDWSERRYHIAGSLGAALTNRMFELEWIRRIPGGRAIQLTPQGKVGLEEEFQLQFDAHLSAPDM